MRFYSLRNKGHQVDFRKSVIQGLAPDGGLYFPNYIPELSREFIDELSQLDDLEIAMHVLAPYVHENIPLRKLSEILKDALNFPIPVVKVSKDIYSLELFHGPTLAFKDVGARFMSRCLSFFSEKEKEVIVLVATSGDTGSAVANGFLGIDGVKVVVLYPDGKVSKIQEKQFASLGQNIYPLAVDGTFDDCQHLVKTAFQDKELSESLSLSSANSINTARWIPQSIYYFLAYKQLVSQSRQLTVSVPSGNLGNVSAGLLAKKMGLPIHKFIIAANENKTIPDYFQTGKYQPRKSVQTVANAMDVGAPSNFTRMLALFNNDFSKIRQYISSVSYSDQQILETIRRCKTDHAYLLDPHGATGFRSLKELNQNQLGLFLETAHPAKFVESISSLNIDIELPESLERFLDRKINAENLPNSFIAFKNYLLSGLN